MSSREIAELTGKKRSRQCDASNGIVNVCTKILTLQNQESTFKHHGNEYKASGTKQT